MEATKKKKSKFKPFDIMITGESSLAASALYGVRHNFEIGQILTAITITKKYCEEHPKQEFIEGPFIQGHGHLPKCYFTRKISEKVYKKYINKLKKQREEEQKKIEKAQKEESRLTRNIEYLKKKIE